MTTSMVLALTLVFAFMAGVGSAALAGLMLLLPERVRAVLMFPMVSFAAGTLLGAAFADLIPDAFEGIRDARAASTTVLAGMLAFLVLERAVLRHCHDRDCPAHATAGPLVLFGDGLHNFVDGIAIAAAFLSSVPSGVAVSVAVLSHEVPQEIGNFVILLDSGFSRRKAFAYNIGSNSAAVVGALAGYLFLERLRAVAPYAMAVSAASFIYIATADLIPELHRRTGRSFPWHYALLFLGAALIVLLTGNHRP